MHPRTSPLAALGLLLACACAGGCEERPQDGLDDLMAALQVGDHDRAWSRFDRPSREMMEELTVALAAGGQVSGDVDAKTYLLGQGRFAPQAAELIEEERRTGDVAVLAVTDFDGKIERVTMRLEDGRWRLHLDGAGKGVPTGALAQEAPSP